MDATTPCALGGEKTGWGFVPVSGESPVPFSDPNRPLFKDSLRSGRHFIFDSNEELCVTIEVSKQFVFSFKVDVHS